MTLARNLALLTARGVLGSYLVAHGAQKLFGAFAAQGGIELPTNMAAALAVADPGQLSIDGLTGIRLPRSFTRLIVVSAAAVGSTGLAMVLRASPPAPPAPEPVATTVEDLPPATGEAS